MWLRPIVVKGWFEGERWKKSIVGVWGRGVGKDRRMWEGLLGYLYDDVVSDPFVRGERIPERYGDLDDLRLRVQARWV